MKQQAASTYSADICQFRRKLYQVQRLLQETRPRSLKLDPGLKRRGVCNRKKTAAFFAAIIASLPHARRRSGTSSRKTMNKQWRGCSKKRKKGKKGNRGGGGQV